MTTLEFDGVAFDPDPAGAPAPPPAPGTHPAGTAPAGSAPSGTASAAAAPAGVTSAGGASAGAALAGSARSGSASAGTDSAAVAAGTAVTAAGSGLPAVDGTNSAAPQWIPVTQRPNPLAELRAGVADAHRAALAAQYALQRALWERARSGRTQNVRADSGPRRDHRAQAARAGGVGDETQAPAPTRAAGPHPAHLPGRVAEPGARTPEFTRAPHAPEWAFKPPARTTRTRLDGAALRRLAEGDVAGVFGPAHRRPGIAAAARLSAAPVLTEVETIELYGGDGRGRLVARFDGDPHAAAAQAAEVFALFAALPLCLSGSTLTTAAPAAEAASRSGGLELRITAIDLIPRPHLTATAHLDDGTVAEVTVTVTEHTGLGPGEPDRALLLNEFHMVHLARGDQAVAMGPEFAPYTGVRATRLPTGGLLLVDRVLDFDGQRGRLDSAAYTTEYDSPADSWYYGDTANESMPHFVYMETSLQAALLMGYYAGPTLTQPGTTLSLRNLGGTATVLRRIDLRDRTIRQQSRLLSTTILPGSSLQTFDYTLSVDGEPFYTGETMFGYFSDEALANQTGLDAGRPAPSWLSRHPEAPTRVIDVAARRATPGSRLCARDTLALIDRMSVVDGGGDHGAGYLHSLREIDPADWYFARHFHLDPVIPGSLGVESVIHAVQEWMVDAGYADEFADPVFRIPAGIAFGWRYRGQFLPTDGTVELEAHIKQVRRGEHGIVAVVDGSLWKPGLRIYELTDLAVELGEREVRP